jgi:hypothetical protein
MTQDALGQYVATGMDRVNYANYEAFKSGIWYATSLYYWCQSNDKSKWDDDYYNGYADPDYWERIAGNTWRLKEGVSASEGLKSWLKGFTVAECNSTVHALEIDAVRASLGDKRFDEIFGSPIKKVPPQLRLVVGVNTGQVEWLFKQTDVSSGVAGIGTEGNRPAKIGEWYYFSNHPKFLLKHPGNDWQGENSIYMGRDSGGQQIWSGLGSQLENSNPVSYHLHEDDMYKVMIRAYNGDRDEQDQRVLELKKAANGGTLPAKYDPTTPESAGGFPDKIDKTRLLEDPPFSGIDGTERKGGFRGGTTLDVDKVKWIRDNVP